MMKLLWRITPRALSSPVNSSIQQFDLFLPWPFHPAEKCLLVEWKKTRRLRRRSLNSTFITVHKASSWIKSCHEVGYPHRIAQMTLESALILFAWQIVVVMPADSGQVGLTRRQRWSHSREADQVQGEYFGKLFVNLKLKVVNFI